MDPEQNTDEAQESASTEVTEETSSAADTASSPDATEGASTSEAAAEKTPAEAIRDEFLKKWGDTDEESSTEADPKAAREDDKSEAKSSTDGETEGEKPAKAKAEDGIDDKTADKDDGDEEFRLSDAEFKALPEGVRKRIGHLNARAKKAERQLEGLNSEFSAAKEEAGRLTQLRAFAEKNNFEPTDVQLAFSLIADLRNGRFKEFLERAEPMIQGAREASGQAFAKDLQDRVDQGYLTEEDAREMTRMRAAEARAKEQSERARQRVQQSQQASQQQAAQQAIVNATVQRGEELKASDPDYAQLEPTILSFVESQLQLAFPRTPEQAVALVNKAHEFAKNNRPKTTPKPPTPPRPSSSAVSRGRKEPASSKEAIQDALINYIPAS